jgi:nitroreductase
MILELMRRRRTVRVFRADPVPDELLLTLVEAAGLAPSAANKQPWRFIVVRDRALIAEVAHETEAELGRLEGAVAGDLKAEAASYAGRFVSLRDAPALVVPIFRPVPGLSMFLAQASDAGVADRIRNLESHAAVVSIAMAMQNLLLAATELGLGTCCATAPLVAAEDLARVLRVPSGWQIAALIAVGYPAEVSSDPGRKPVQSIVKWK